MTEYQYAPTGHKGVRRYRLKKGGVRYYAQGYADHHLTYLGRYDTLDRAIAAVAAFDAGHPVRPSRPSRPSRGRKPMPAKAAAELAAMEAETNAAIDGLKRPPGRDEWLCPACGGAFAVKPERCGHCGGFYFERVRIPDHPVAQNYPTHHL